MRECFAMGPSDFLTDHMAALLYWGLLAPEITPTHICVGSRAWDRFFGISVGEPPEI